MYACTFAAEYRKHLRSKFLTLHTCKFHTYILALRATQTAIMLICSFANKQKLHIFSKPEDETYVAKVIKIVTATCALNLPLYDLLKEMYHF